jgi:hypothetical protein
VEGLETVFIVRPMTPFNKPVLPRTMGLDGPMLNPSRRRFLLKGRLILGMSRVAHGKRPGMIRYDEKKGGKRRGASSSTAASVGDVASVRISEYFSRVRK